MRYRTIFRLPALALLLAGCGTDLTETACGPGDSGSGGDGIAWPFFDRQRRRGGRTARDPHGLRAPARRRLSDLLAQWRRVEILCPQTTPQRAAVTVSVSGATESEADLSDTGMAWGSDERYNFYAFYRLRPSGPTADRSS